MVTADGVRTAVRGVAPLPMTTLFVRGVRGVSMSRLVLCCLLAIWCGAVCVRGSFLGGPRGRHGVWLHSGLPESEAFGG